MKAINSHCDDEEYLSSLLDEENWETILENPQIYLPVLLVRDHSAEIQEKVNYFFSREGNLAWGRENILMPSVFKMLIITSNCPSAVKDSLLLSLFSLREFSPFAFDASGFDDMEEIDSPLTKVRKL